MKHGNSTTPVLFEATLERGAANGNLVPSPSLKNMTPSLAGNHALTHCSLLIVSSSNFSNTLLEPF